jgi:chromosome segregation and condensation protein ScpB
MKQPEPEALDNAPETIRKAVQQLSFAYSRSEQTLTTTQAEAMADAMRRAEAVLFAAGEPLSAEQVAETLPQGVEAADVLMALQAQFKNRGVQLVEVAGKWRFQSAADLDFLFVEERQEQKKLTQASLETLAIIAYGQPVTRAEIEAVRGVAVSKGTVDTLMETGWIRIKGSALADPNDQEPLQVTYSYIGNVLTREQLERYEQQIKALEKVPGVADVKVDTRAETVTVTFESSQTDAAGIARAVTEAGFPAKVRTGGE